MSSERAHDDRESKRAVVLLGLLTLLVLAVCAQLVEAVSADGSSSEVNVVTMNFHMYQPVYVNSNSSILVFSGADTSPATHASPIATVVSCEVRQNAQIWFAGVDVWLGGVSWITEPLAQTVTIQGDVSMTVWMSAVDGLPLASGYVFGLAEVDNMGNPVGGQFYQYHYSYGDVLGHSPMQFTLTFSVDRTFAKGNVLGFFVIVGSTTQGWHYQAYYDSSGMNSFAEVPFLGTPIPEFSQLGALVSMAIAVLCSYAVKRRN